MANLGQTLNAVAADIIPLVNALSAKSDSQSQADASALSGVVNRLLSDAMQANALDVEAKLASDAKALQHLTSFTTQADGRAKALAASEASVKKFVSLATHVGNALVAAAGGDIVGCGSALFDAGSDLGISAP